MQSSSLLLIAMFVQVFDCDAWHIFFCRTHIPSGIHPLSLFLDSPLSVFLALPFLYISVTS